MKTLRILLSTLSMYVVTHLFVFAVLPFAFLAACIAPDRLPALKQWFVRSLFAIVGKELKVTGYEHVEPGRAYLIVANYPGFYAGFSLIGVFPRACVVAAAFIKKIPLLGAVLNRFGTIFVQPGPAGKGKRAIDLHLDTADPSRSVIIFPEGRRTPDGQIHRFRRGFLYILRQSTLDLLPVTLNGLYRLKPVKRFHLDPDAQPEMIIHAPLGGAAARETSDAELLARVHATISAAYQP